MYVLFGYFFFKLWDYLIKSSIHHPQETLIFIMIFSAIMLEGLENCVLKR